MRNEGGNTTGSEYAMSAFRSLFTCYPSAISVSGSTEVDKIERLFHGLDLEDDDYTTIAGLVTSEAGHVPKKGEHLDLRGLSIEILDADEKRVNLLRLRAAIAPDREAAGE